MYIFVCRLIYFAKERKQKNINDDERKERKQKNIYKRNDDERRERKKETNVVDIEIGFEMKKKKLKREQKDNNS